MPRQHKINRSNHAFMSHHASAHLPFIFAQRTIACERHPNRNEDSLMIDEWSGLVAVFDGVGGSAAGEIASQIAAYATRQSWMEVLNKLQQGRKVHTYLNYSESLNICTVLEHLVQEADKLVRTEGARRAGTDDLATTVAVAAFCRDPQTHGYRMVYAHVGDSRIYLFRESDGLTRLTNDDGLLAKLVENQIVNETDALRIDQAVRAEDLSDTEFSYFRLRGGITQALGGPMPPTIHTNQISIAPGNRILLCTDGIHDNLTDQEIENLLRVSPRTSAARLLVEHSLNRSRQERSMTVRAKPDDMTAVVLTCRF